MWNRNPFYIKRSFYLLLMASAKRKRDEEAEGQEWKYLDRSYGPTGVSITAAMSGAEADPSSVNCLNSTGTGDGGSNRNGRLIFMKSIHVSGIVQYYWSGGTVTQVDRNPIVAIWLVHDRQTNGAQLNSEDVFVNPLANAVTNICAFRNLDYEQRFDVLHKELIVMKQTNIETVGGGGGVKGGANTVPFNFIVRLRDMPVTFTDTGANVTSISDNSLHLVAVADCNGQILPQLAYNSRLRFVDG